MRGTVYDNQSQFHIVVETNLVSGRYVSIIKQSSEVIDMVEGVVFAVYLTKDVIRAVATVMVNGVTRDLPTLMADINDTCSKLSLSLAEVSKTHIPREEFEQYKSDIATQFKTVLKDKIC
jgi:gamma-glutamyl:cysteine ligase YbdK (ATP-grasp superfamily)